MIEALSEVDGGSRRSHARTRMCAVTREVAAEADLIRFVAAPDGSVVPDLRAKLPGRGVWIGLSRERVAEAARRNVFARALKRPVTPTAGLADQVAARLREAALGRLGLARKAGAVAAGFTKAEAAVLRDQPAALVIAADAAADGRRKMEQAVFRRYRESQALPVIRLFSAAELGLAMGRPDVIHAAVLQGPAGRSFVEAAIRLQRYEGVGDARLDDRTDVKDE